MSLLGMMPKSGFIFCSILFILHTCFALFNGKLLAFVWCRNIVLSGLYHLIS